jgi:hypothetical protein
VRRKRLLAWLIIAGAVAVAASFVPPAPSPAPEARAPIASQLRDAPASRGRFALPERETLGKERGEVFAALAGAGAASCRHGAHAGAERTPCAAAHALPRRRASGAGKRCACRARKRRCRAQVREGEALDGGYRVESIEPQGVTLVYLPLGVRETLPVASTLSVAAAIRPAQVRWEGPERVRKGDTFEVALKVTSERSLDAKLLELVAVRSGGFFGAKGKFSSRVSPEGYVSVGASGPGRLASDAELVVFTFKPLRPAIAAELKLSSLVLQGSAYRTAILP